MLKEEPFCEPFCTGLNSEPRAVASRLGELLTALDRVDSRIIKGTIAVETYEFRRRLHDRLKSEGWRITAKQDGWKVLPPLSKK